MKQTRTQRTIMLFGGDAALWSIEADILRAVQSVIAANWHTEQDEWLLEYPGDSPTQYTVEIIIEAKR